MVALLFITFINLCFYCRERKYDDAGMSVFCVAIFKMIISCQQLELAILTNTLLRGSPFSRVYQLHGNESVSL